MNNVSDEQSSFILDASEFVDAADRILSTDNERDWVTNGVIQLDGKSWRPTAISQDGKHLLSVILQGEIPRYIRTRIKLAHEGGVGVVIALNTSSLFDSEVVQLLVEVDAEVIVLDDYAEPQQLIRRSVLAALADIGVPIAPPVRHNILNIAWSRIGEGTPQTRGRRLEAMLAFLFSQIEDLKVVERNYRTATEEIDIILQVDGVRPRAWQKPGVPYLLVEAKNRADKASQQVVSTLITKLQTKRGSARIAILVSIAGFTEDAKLHELRFSSTDICVVMIDGSALEKLMAADDISTAFEAVVRRALLR